MGEVVPVKNIQEKLKTLREGKKVVFTNGCFDILHIGHVRYLQEARAQGDILVVGLNADASVRRLKGDERPIQHEEDRAGILSALECVNYVVLFEQDTPLELIHQVKPDVLVKGGDWPIQKIVGSSFVLDNGGEVKSLQFVEGRSSTGIIDRIKTL